MVIRSPNQYAANVAARHSFQQAISQSVSLLANNDIRNMQNHQNDILLAWCKLFDTTARTLPWISETANLSHRSFVFFEPLEEAMKDVTYR